MNKRPIPKARRLVPSIGGFNISQTMLGGGLAKIANAQDVIPFPRVPHGLGEVSGIFSGGKLFIASIAITFWKQPLPAAKIRQTGLTCCLAL